VLAPAAADPVLDLDSVVHWLICFFFFFIWKVFAFCSFGSLHAAIGCLQAASALIPMAQIKPTSSRAIAVMVPCEAQPGRSFRERGSFADSAFLRSGVEKCPAFNS